MSILNLYLNLSQASVLLPVIAGLFLFRKLNLSNKILLFFFLSSIFFESFSIFLKKVFHNNLPGLHLFTATEFFAFCCVFYFYFSQKNIQKIILLNGIVFFLIAIADATFINTIWKFNTYSRTYASAVLVIYSLIYFYKLMESDEIINLWQSSIFWINIGVLFYFAPNLFFFMLSNYISSTDVKLIPIGLYFHSTINIIANCIFAYSYSCIRKNKI